MKNSFDGEKPEWNANLAFLQRLDRRCDERDLAAINGELLKWYRTLRVVFRNIHFRVKDKGNEKQELELIAKFDELKNMLMSTLTLTQTTKENALSKVEISLDELDIKLNDLIQEYGFIFPEKKKRELEEELEDDFKGDE